MRVFAYDREYTGTPYEILEGLREDLGNPNVKDFPTYVMHVGDVLLRYFGMKLDLLEGASQEEASGHIIKKLCRMGLMTMLEKDVPPEAPSGDHEKGGQLHE